ncbi:MAG TPA: hypothetical protein VOA80_02855 [Thermoanaerobaculia bacterium]|nr:hypothetical protein [Thermoanaerobaculia bacterium]
MTIEFQPGEPENGRALAAAGVERLLLQNGEALGPGLRVARPHRSFTCSIADAADDVVAHAAFAAWRYLVFRGEDCVATARVKQRPGEQTAILSSIVFGGDFSVQLADLDWLVVQAGVEQADFELRFLRVRGLWVAAWWLSRGAGGAGDLFVPVPPSQQALRPQQHTLYRGAEQFSPAVRKVARQKQDAAAVLFAGIPGQ